MSSERPLPEKRTWLPLAGIVLSLVALLLVPIVVGRQSAKLRDTILDRQFAVRLAVESFRMAAAEEMAATRGFLNAPDAGTLAWMQEAAENREGAQERLRASVPGVMPAGGRMSTLDSITARLPAWSAWITAGPAALPVSVDTIVLWREWTAALSAADALRGAVDGEIAATSAQIDWLETIGLVLTTFLAFLAFTSAMVAARMDGRLRTFALQSERARKRQQILLESSGEGVFGVDDRGHCTFLNPAGARLIGYPEESVLGRDLREMILHEPREFAPETFLTTRGFAGGELGQLEETTIRRRTGEVLEAECLTSPIVERGEVRGAVVTLRNISQRKAVERERLALLQREQTLRERAEAAERRAKFLAEASELFASSLDLDTTLNSLSGLVVPGIADSCIVYLLDDEGTVHRLEPVHVDPERQRILSDQLQRYPPRLETLIPPIRVALTEGQPALIHRVHEPEMKGVPGDESHHSVIDTVGLQSLIVVPLRARGRIVGAISYGVAGSGRRYGPEDLALAEDLSTRAALAIDNASLYQQSQAAVQARNEVLGIVSHDLRNPLNAVRFGAQALLRHWPPLGDGEIERNQLGAITKAADRMHRLIRDLLDLAQIDAGKLAVEPSPVPAAILLDDALELSSPAATDKGITITLAPFPDLPVISADGERILQVFSNLLSNAIKFSPAGTEVVVGAERAGDELVFRVADRGRGIEPELIPHIFKRFWKARNGSRDGAGLGLAIARGIVDSHGGRIWVVSSVGSGSTFYFTLPVGEEPRVAPPRAAVATSAG